MNNIDVRYIQKSDYLHVYVTGYYDKLRSEKPHFAIYKKIYEVSKLQPETRATLVDYRGMRGSLDNEDRGRLIPHIERSFREHLIDGGRFHETVILFSDKYPDFTLSKVLTQSLGLSVLLTKDYIEASEWLGVHIS